MIYFYWGGQKLSFLRYMSLYSACKYIKQVSLVLRREVLREQPLASGWEVRQDFNAYKGPDYLPDVFRLKDQGLIQIVYLEDFCKEVAELRYNDIYTSDLLSWYILAFHGGTVSDTDILYFRPLPETEANVELIRFRQYPLPGYVTVSFMRAKEGGDEFFLDMYKEALAATTGTYECLGAPLFSPDKVWLLLRLKKVKWLDPKIVFPFADTQAQKRYRRLLFHRRVKLPEETIGIHWYAGNNQDFNNRITRSNYWDKRNRCTITSLIRSVLKDASQ